MQNNCSFLRIVWPTWGPSWQPHQTGFAYLSDLQTYLNDQQRNNKTYTAYEIAAEIIQQANQHGWYKLMATNLLIGLQTYQNKPVPPEYNSYALVSTFEANKLPSKISINKMNSNNPQTGKSPNKRRFQYRREVQCRACHGYGHDTDEDICRYTAQHYHATKFCTEHPDKAKSNAQAFHTANNRNHINKIQTRLPHLFLPDQTEEQCDQMILDLAHILTNDNMP